MWTRLPEANRASLGLKTALARRGVGRFRRHCRDAAEAQHDPGAVMVGIALGTGVQLGGHCAYDALSHAGGAWVGLGVEADAVVRNRDHEVVALGLEIDVNRPGAIGIGVF